MKHLSIQSLCAGDESESRCQLFLQSGSVSVSFALNEHCSQCLLFIVWLMATLKMPFEKLVMSVQMEGEGAAHQSLHDINILFAEEGVIARSVCMQ